MLILFEPRGQIAIARHWSKHGVLMFPLNLLERVSVEESVICKQSVLLVVSKIRFRGVSGLIVANAGVVCRSTNVDRNAFGQLALTIE